MKTELSFGRKIDHRPLINSLLVSALTCAVTAIFNPQAMVVACIGSYLLTLFVIYPLFLKTLYGYWRVNIVGINYYPMDSYQKRLAFILFPETSRLTSLKFEDIQSYQLHQSSHLHLYPAKKPSRLAVISHPLYLELKMDNGQVFNLDLSWDATHSLQWQDKLSVTLKMLYDVDN